MHIVGPMLGWLALAARGLLSAIFIVGGLTKLLDSKNSSAALEEFGLPRWSAEPAALGLSLIEIVVAVLMLPLATALIGAVGAFSLLSTFSIAIAINIGLGRHPHCNCLGQVHSTPISWRTFARTSTLAASAASVAWYLRTYGRDGLPSLAGMSTPEILVVIQAAVVFALLALVAWLVLHLFRQNGRLLLRIEALEAAQRIDAVQAPRKVSRGLQPGTPAIAFDLPSVDGNRRSLHGILSQQKPILLISTNPICGPCNALMSEVGVWQKAHADELSIVLLSRGRLEQNRAKASEHGLENVLIEPDDRIAERYHALGTPTAVLIHSDGTIGSYTMSGPPAIREFMARRGWATADYTRPSQSLEVSIAQPFKTEAA